MESFYSLVFALGLSNVLEGCLFDIVGKLPEEMGIMILRMLDSRTLLSAAMVSKKWLNLCHADKTLQTRIRQQIRQERKECLDPFVITIERNCQNNNRALRTLNGCHRTTVSAVSNFVHQRRAKTELPVIQYFTVPSARQSQRVPMKRKLSKISERNGNASKGKLIRL